MLRVRRNGILRDRRIAGNNLVEFAMVLPLLLTMFMGVFDFGWILHQQIALDNATREGARRGAIGATDTQIIERVQEMCEFDVDVDQITISAFDENGTPAAAGSRDPDGLIVVEVDVPDIELITPIRSFVETIGTINLHSEARFRVE